MYAARKFTMYTSGTHPTLFRSHLENILATIVVSDPHADVRDGTARYGIQMGSGRVEPLWADASDESNTMPATITLALPKVPTPAASAGLPPAHQPRDVTLLVYLLNIYVRLICRSEGCPS
jgi:hypothetical protein